MEALVRRFLDNGISRREFVRQLCALGFTAAAAQSLLAQVETMRRSERARASTPEEWCGCATLPQPTGTAETGNWWDDTNTDQAVVDRMTSRTLQALTGERTDKQAWDALFHHFNRTHGFGNVGYRAGEKIAIKINCNQDRSAQWGAARRGGRPPGAMPPGGGPPPGYRRAAVRPRRATGARTERAAQPARHPRAGDPVDHDGWRAGRRHHDLRGRGRTQHRPARLHEDQGERETRLPGGHLPGEHRPRAWRAGHADGGHHQPGPLLEGGCADGVPAAAGHRGEVHDQPRAAARAHHGRRDALRRRTTSARSISRTTAAGRRRRCTATS